MSARDDGAGSLRLWILGLFFLLPLAGFPWDSGAPRAFASLTDDERLDDLVVHALPGSATPSAAITIRLSTNPSDSNQVFPFEGDIEANLHVLSAAGETFTEIVEPGTYTSTEIVPDGWELTNITCVDPTGHSSGDTGTATATFVVIDDESIECTFSNSGGGTIVIRNDSPGPSQLFTFTGDVAGTISNTGTLSRGGRAASDYVVRETVPAGWELVEISCSDSDSSGNLAKATADIQLAAGEEVSCTFRNEPVGDDDDDDDEGTGTLIIAKTTVPGGGAQAFTFTGSFIEAEVAHGQEHVFVVPPGTYSVTEQALGQWELTNIICDDANSSGNVASGTATYRIEDGETVTCTFVNAQPSPPPGAWMTSLTDFSFADYQFKVRITSATGETLSSQQDDFCISETICISGAIPGRSEVFLRLVGPKPNGYIWPTLVKFTTSQVEVWANQLSTNETNYYVLAGARPGFDELPGLFDRLGFLPSAATSSSEARIRMVERQQPVFLPADGPPPPSGDWMFSSSFPDFRAKARITSPSGDVITPVQESDCISETICVSGAVPGRSEIYIRVVGPKPNGFMWPTLVKFTTSQVEIWIEQLSTGEIQYYLLAGASPSSSDLTGLFDREGFLP